MAKDKFSQHPFAVRRKIVEQIPFDTLYCYTPIGFEDDIYHVKTCPYWESIGRQKGMCTLLNIKDKCAQDFTLLWDQVKICGLREGCYSRNMSK